MRTVDAAHATVKTLRKRLPAELIERFCEAIAYAKEDRGPTPPERESLQQSLVAIARAANRIGITPERVLIQLKSEWTRVCHREPSPDMHDPLWNAVVRIALDAYEQVREVA
jgi:hypothetical protein